MTQFYQSKIFANGSTTLPKPVRDALGIKAGDLAVREALDAAEKVMDENRSLLRKLK
jgi:bifunctional DNA-binding transcriptional regulator/antitoxin component of YhaV-PrlF toxin-antitoxin module